MNSSELHIRRWVATLVVLAAVAGGILLTIGVRNWSSDSVYGAGKIPVTVSRNNSPVPLGTFANGFAAVLKPVLPAVVNVHSSKVVKPRSNQMMPFFNDPFFQQFFGNQFGQNMQPQPEREQSLGSGVILTSDGTIITNNHVVDGATDIKVSLADKREFTAKVIGTDKPSDIAVLKINATGLPTLPIGDSSKLQVGDVVLAIGDPFGIGETATMGIVSAKGRGGHLGIETYEDFIQTDAAINPGNSGGALIDLHGNLVGINTAIATGGGGGGNVGIGFAIPIDMAHKVMDQIVEHGKVIRGYLGLLPEDVSASLAKQFGLSQATGALVASVEKDTPASRAGLKQGDIVLKVNGQTVDSANDLRLLISQSQPGASVNLTIWRDNKTQDVKVTLAELPQQNAQNGASEGNGSGTMQGVQVQTVTPDMSQDLGVPNGTRGVVITSVDPSSPAAAASLERGIIIQEVNHKPVNNAQEYHAALQGADDHPVLLLIMIPNSDGQQRYVVVEPQ
ncbi:MAG TPA: Do family serine endopeptidase [Candidatus Acidoferrales bacterium]|nr:Do family serine endopeptidase [Candidatus Acidoferrales bacterium]